MQQQISALWSARQRVFGLLVSFALVAILTACAPSAQPTPAVAQPIQAPAPTEAPTQAPAPTEAPTQAPAPTEAPTQAPAPTNVPTQAPAPTEAPTQAPAPTDVPTQAPAPTDVPTLAPTQSAAVTFARDVRPILDQRCLNCHGGKDGVKGGLSMKSYEDLMKGGSEGAAVVPGDPANSLLVQLINSGEMPKRAPKLPQSEIDVIMAWVAAGAKND